MISSKKKNGITINKDIELVMKNTGYTPWYCYVLHYIFVCILCVSICFSFLSAFQIEVTNFVVVATIILFVAYFTTIYSFRSIFKYTGLVTLFLYVMFGYLQLEQLQDGYGRIYNVVIKLYNSYFNDSLAKISVSKGTSDGSEQMFLLFVMFTVAAIVTYTAMYGKTMVYYVIVTVPVVFLSFIVGVTPDMMPYIVYVTSTIALFAGAISEKYGLYSKINKVKIGSSIVMMLEKTRVIIQTLCFTVLFIIFGAVYLWYSPNRYDLEFDANEVKADLQNKIKDITSSGLLKDTILDKVIDGNINSGNSANSGLSNGKLGRVNNITYKNETALTVTTVDTGHNNTIYLKGYIGETYTSNSWKTLSNRDQNRIDELSASLRYATNVEDIPMTFWNLYASGIYSMYNVDYAELNVINVSADTSCDYVPYNTTNDYFLDDGQISSVADGTLDYYNINWDASGNIGLTNEEMFYKYFRVPALLQFNTVNLQILNNAYDDNYSIEESVPSNLLGIDASDIDKSGMAPQDTILPVICSEGMNTETFEELVSSMNDYAVDESAYFNLVKEIYTKLPEEGLDQVKELVADKHVEFAGTDMGGAAYTSINQIDTTAFAYKMYDIYKDGYSEFAEELLNPDLTYDELLNQDKVFEAITFVKDYLASNTTYSLSPGKTPSSEDYVEYFLFQNKKGYCMHYASAATVMLRAMGVPARYVEGYIVTSDDFDKATVLGETYYKTYVDGEQEEVLGNTIRMDIKDTNAHAWVEVYLPGYGWTPIEMTAPYSNEGTVEIPPVNSDPNATLKPVPTPTVTPSSSTSPTATVQPSTAPGATNQPGTVKDTSLLEKISDWYDGLSTTTKRTISGIVKLLLFVALMVIAVIVRRKILIAYFTKQMQQGTLKEQILYLYKEIGRVALYRIKPYETTESYASYAKRFVEQFEFVQKEDADILFAIILKAKFSQGEMSEDDRDFVMSFYRQYTCVLYQQSSKAKQLYYRYLFIMK